VERTLLERKRPSTFGIDITEITDKELSDLVICHMYVFHDIFAGLNLSRDDEKDVDLADSRIRLLVQEFLRRLRKQVLDKNEVRQVNESMNEPWARKQRARDAGTNSKAASSN